MLMRRILAGATACFLALGAACAGPTGASDRSDRVIIETAQGDRVFKVEIADDDEERRIGLMYRTTMPEDAGMLFDFGPAEEIRSMWMKNTLIPLDMAFIAADGRIVRIAENTLPRSLASIGSGEPALAVLEVNGGRFSALGVKTGDYVRHPLFEKR